MSDSRTPPIAYEFAGFRLEPARRALTRPDGSPARLSGKPFDTLVYLVERAGGLVDRDELLRGVWPKRVIEDNNLNQAIATVRRVLGEQHVVTVAGRGYQFVTPVERLASLDGRAADPAVPAAAPPPAAQPVAAVAPHSVRWRWLALAAAAAAAVVIAVLAFVPLRSTSSTSLVGATVRVQLLTTYPGEELTPALSPEGTRVAFSWRGPSGTRDLYVTQVGVAAPIRLSDSGGANDLYPAWSPDGARIAFMRYYDRERFDVMVMPALGGEAQPKYRGSMYPISLDGFPLLAWTSDGRQLVFTTERTGDGVERTFALHRLSLDTGRIVDLGLTDDPLHYDTSPAVSPDGQWLAFTRYKRGERLNQVAVQRLGPNFTPVGAPRLVPDVEEGIHDSLAWAPSGNRLWFSNGARIFEWGFDGAPRVVHTLGREFSSQTTAIVGRPGGARAAVVVVRADTDLFAVPVDPATHEATGEAAVHAPSSGVDQHPQFSPDGSMLAFVSDRSGSREVWLANPGGSNPRQLTHVSQLIVGYPRWSPDGKSIAFHSSAPGEPRVVYRVDVESGVTTRLFNACCPGGWSADGGSLYVTELGPVSYALRVNVATGASERLLEGANATESADGRYLLYAKERESGYFRWPLYASSGNAGEERLVDDYRASDGGIAPVADGFYYVAVDENSLPRALRFYSYAAGVAKDVAPVPTHTAIGLTVSGDGREVVYAAVPGTPEADIQLLELDGAVE